MTGMWGVKRISRVTAGVEKRGTLKVEIKGMLGRMASTKEQLRELIERLPDDCTVEDVQYHLYVQQKVERGLEDVRACRVLSQAAVERRMVILPIMRRRCLWQKSVLA